MLLVDTRHQTQARDLAGFLQSLHDWTIRDRRKSHESRVGLGEGHGQVSSRTGCPGICLPGRYYSIFVWVFFMGAGEDWRWSWRVEVEG